MKPWVQEELWGRRDLIVIISQDCENAKYLQGDQIPKNVVRAVRSQHPLVLRENRASPVSFKVHLWKEKHIWLKSDFGVMEFMWTGISPFSLMEALLAGCHTQSRKPTLSAPKDSPKWPLFKAHLTHKQSGVSLWIPSQQNQKYHYSA